MSFLMLVVEQTQEIALQHRYGYFTNRWNIYRGNILDFRLKITHTGKIDCHYSWFQQASGHLVGGRRDTSNNYIALGNNIFWFEIGLGGSIAVDRGSPIALKDLDIVNVNGIDLGTVVRQQGSQGTTNYLATVNNSDGLTSQMVAVGQRMIIHADMVEYFDHSQWSAGENSLACLIVVQEPIIAVEFAIVDNIESLDILGGINQIL